MSKFKLHQKVGVNEFEGTVDYIGEIVHDLQSGHYEVKICDDTRIYGEDELSELEWEPWVPEND